MSLIMFSSSSTWSRVAGVYAATATLVFWALPLRCLHVSQQQQQFTIMLDPAGDAQNVGRTIEDSFERSLTLQWAEAIKRDVETKCPEITVVLTRLPGEVVQPLQNANFANRLDVDFYLNLRVYQELGHKAGLALFTFSYGDDFINISPHLEQLSFLPVDQAHKKSALKSARYTSTLYQSLKKDVRSASLDIHGVITCPVKSLVGIAVPACSIELGLKHKDDWLRYVECLSDILIELAHQGMRS